jgi:beta-glucosidase
MTHTETRQEKPDPQIEALLARMTIDEKVGQLTLLADDIRVVIPNINPDVNRRKSEELLDEIRAGRVGSLFNGLGVAGGLIAQKAAVEQSRLKIPLLFGADVIHGLRTVFPIPLAEAASFEPDLAEKTARVAAIEATAMGLHWTFAPMVDVARDQRWGRVCEGAGEDVYLGKLFAAARVRGFQGSSLTNEDSMLATPKHFAAYGAVVAGLDYNSVDISEQTLREIHFPPFQAAFEAGALSTMSAFNDINGVPASANHWLSTDVLRGEWGFRGLVVSDYTADKELILHGFAADDQQATQLAFNAGVDMSMQSGLYSAHLAKLVKDGGVKQATLDGSVRRVLRVKKALGLFDNPYRSLDPARETKDIGTPEHRKLAQEAARRSIVMLKNEDGVLPLKKSTRIALIGPLADQSNLHGPWTLFANASEAISVQDGLTRAAGDDAHIKVVKGSEIDAPIEGGIAAAVAAAKAADVVLLAIGESERMSGEAQSRTEIIVPAAQQALADAVSGAGKPVVVLLRTGRALALKGAVRDAQAILVTWFLGSETGSAVADVVFGDFNPSGRLPVSFPFESGQEPYYYNHKSTGRPYHAGGLKEFTARYRETDNEALYSFGSGMGFAPFTYDETQLSSESLAWNGNIVVSSRIVNTGKVAGEEVVQLYIRDRVASITRPVRELKGFRKIKLEPGASQTVSFELTRRDLEFVGANQQWLAEPGEFDVWIAPSASTGTAQRFRLEK